MCAALLSSFKPACGLLVIISHRADSANHLIKEDDEREVDFHVVIFYITFILRCPYPSI
jgi:hypothetical protein